VDAVRDLPQFVQGGTQAISQPRQLALTWSAGRGVIVSIIWAFSASETRRCWIPSCRSRSMLPGTAILVLSAYAEVEHAMELLAGGGGIGYLLKSRVTDVEDFLDTLARIARGGSVVDPALVHELVTARRRDDPLDVLSGREREVLALMAEGRSNAGIARQLWVTEGTVEKHVRAILTKLNLPEAGDDHRRVLAVITFLDAR
jgi:serine/threonine-protein kinase PknK